MHQILMPQNFFSRLSIITIYIKGIFLFSAYLLTPRKLKEGSSNEQKSVTIG